MAIDEASYGPQRPEVAFRLNNLAGLLRATNRPAEAEPLYRRALAIDEASYGPRHPEVATDPVLCINRHHGGMVQIGTNHHLSTGSPIMRMGRR